jgi:hypothetical protein
MLTTVSRLGAVQPDPASYKQDRAYERRRAMTTAVLDAKTEYDVVEFRRSAIV